MSNLSILLERIHDRRIKAGYRESGPPRERIPPDYIDPCVRYPTVALVAFLAAIGVALALAGLSIWLLVVANRIPTPAVTPKSALKKAAVSAELAADTPAG